MNKIILFIICIGISKQVVSQLYVPYIYEANIGKYFYNNDDQRSLERHHRSNAQRWYIYADRDTIAFADSLLKTNNNRSISLGDKLVVETNSNKSLRICNDRNLLNNVRDYSPLDLSQSCDIGWISRAYLLLSNSCKYDTETYSTQKALTIHREIIGSKVIDKRTTNGYRSPTNSTIVVSYKPFTLVYIYKQIGKRYLVSQDNILDNSSRIDYQPQLSWVDSTDLFIWNSNIYVDINNDKIAQIEMSERNFYISFFKNIDSAKAWRDGICDQVEFPQRHYDDTSTGGSIIKPILIEQTDDTDIIELRGVDPIIDDTFDTEYKGKQSKALRADRHQTEIIFAIDYADLINNYSVIEGLLNELPAKISDKQIRSNVKYGCVIYFSAASKYQCDSTKKLLDLAGIKDWLKQSSSRLKNYSFDTNYKYDNVLTAINISLNLYSDDLRKNKVLVLLGRKCDSSDYDNKFRETVINRISRKNINIVCIQSATNGIENYLRFINDMRDIILQSARKQMALVHGVLRSRHIVSPRIDSVTEVYHVLKNSGVLGSMKYSSGRIDGIKYLSSGMIKDDILNTVVHSIRLSDSLDSIESLPQYVRLDDNIAAKRQFWEYVMLTADSTKIAKMIKQLDTCQSQFITPVYSSMHCPGINSPIFRKYILLSQKSYDSLVENIRIIYQSDISHSSIKNIIKQVGFVFMGGLEVVPLSKKDQIAEMNNANLYFAFEKVKAYSVNYRKILYDMAYNTKKTKWQLLKSFYANSYHGLENIKRLPSAKFLDRGKVSYWVPEDLLVPNY